MRLFAYYRSFSLYRRSLNTLAIGMSLAVIVLTLLLSQVFTNALIAEARRQAERTATVTAGNIARLYDELNTVAAYLGNDNANINTMMFQQTSDRLREYAGYLAMRQLQSTYSSISFIAVYNQNMDSLASTASLTPASRAAIKAEALSRYAEPDRGALALMDLRIAAPDGIPPTLPSVAVFFFSPLSTGRSIGAVVIGLDCQYLQSYIGTLAEDERQTAILASPDGRLISHPDHAQILEDVSAEPYMAGVMAAQPGLGTIRRESDGQDMMITYYKSMRGWTYISMIPYQVILQKVTSWRNVTVLIAAIVLALAIAYALLGARHTFLPIRRMMDVSGYPVAPGVSHGADLDFLNEQIAAYKSRRQQDHMMREDALRAWLQGQISWDKLPPDGAPDGLPGGLPPVPGAPLRLALLRVDPTEAFGALAPDAQRTLLGALGDYALDALGGAGEGGEGAPSGPTSRSIADGAARQPAGGRASARIAPSGALIVERGASARPTRRVSRGGAGAKRLHHPIAAEVGAASAGPIEARAIALPPNRLALVMRDGGEDTVRAALLQALGRFRDQFSQAGCAALSASVPDAKTLPEAFRAAAALLEERFYAPDDRAAVYMTSPRREAEAAPDADLEEALRLAVERRDERALDVSLVRLAEWAARLQPQAVRDGIRGMLSRLLTADPCGAGPDEATERRAIERTVARDTLNEICFSARAVMVGWMAREQSDGGQDAGRRALDLAVELTRRRYSDPAFSINAVSEELGLSPSYFNRLFRKLTGESYTAYLTGYRLHRVCALLRTTAQPLGEICRQVGLANESYCYTLFKKEYGVTPSQYRERYRIEEGADAIIE